ERRSMRFGNEHWNQGIVPSLHHRKEGWLRHQKNFVQPSKTDAAGVVFHFFLSENHPGLAISGCFAIFFDRSATPPCGDARRGLARNFRFIQTFRDRRRCLRHRGRSQTVLTVLMLVTLVCLACRGTASAQQAAAQSRLKYAIVVSRHGVRAPTWTPDRLNQYSSEPWPDWEVPPGNLTLHGRQLMKIMGGFYRDYFVAEGLLGARNCSDVSRNPFSAGTDQRMMETAVALAEGIFPECKVDIHSVGDGKADSLFDPIEAGVVEQDSRLGLAAVAGRIGPQPAALVEAHRAAFDVLDRVLNG